MRFLPRPTLHENRRCQRQMKRHIYSSLTPGSPSRVMRLTQRNDVAAVELQLRKVSDFLWVMQLLSVLVDILSKTICAKYELRFSEQRCSELRPSVIVAATGTRAAPPICLPSLAAVTVTPAVVRQCWASWMLTGPLWRVGHLLQRKLSPLDAGIQRINPRWI